MGFNSATLFSSLYCGSIGLQALIHFREQLRFFRTSPARVYGPSPKLLGIVAWPAVKEPVFVSAGAMFILALAAAAAGISFRLSLAVALAAFFVYFPPILSLNYLGRKADMIPLVLIAMLAAPARAPQVARVLVSLVFLSGGIEKLRNAGFRWADGKSFQSYLIRHHLISGGNAAFWLAHRPGLCRFFSICVLAWELTFWIAVLFPLAGTVWAVVGIVFLVSTAILMRIHYWIYFGPLYFAFLTPWICARS